MVATGRLKQKRLFRTASAPAGRTQLDLASEIGVGTESLRPSRSFTELRPDLFGQFQYPTPPSRRLDTTRIYRDAYEQAGLADGLLSDAGAEHEADTEFADDEEGVS